MKTLLFLFVALLAAWALFGLLGCASVPGSISLGYEGMDLTYQWRCGDCKKLQHFEK